MKKLDVGRLPELQSLSLRGVHWHWEAIHTVLQSATELRELSMRVEFCGDADKLEPFPEIDFVDFFKVTLNFGVSKLKEQCSLRSPIGTVSSRYHVEIVFVSLAYQTVS